MKNIHKILAKKNVKGPNHSEESGVYGKIILKGILQKYGVKMWS
jgi:hypothetical protein